MSFHGSNPFRWCDESMIPERYYGNETFYTKRLERLKDEFNSIGFVSAMNSAGNVFDIAHDNAGIPICFFGVVSNIITIIVLTRKSMESSTNVTLGALAVADMLSLTSTIFIHYNWSYNSDSDTGEDVDGVLQICRYVFNAVSVWLTVVVAIWRYMMVCHASYATQFKSIIKARIAVLLTTAAGILFFIPRYMYFSGWQEHFIETLEEKVDDLYVCKYNRSLYEQANQYAYIVFVKVLPAVITSILSVLLVLEIKKVDARRASLKSQSSRSNKNVRITKMLLGLMIIFVIAYLPHGILTLAGEISDNIYVFSVYDSFGSLSTLLSILNSAVNIIFYYIMNTQYRKILNGMIVSCLIDANPPPPAGNF